MTDCWCMTYELSLSKKLKGYKVKGRSRTGSGKRGNLWSFDLENERLSKQGVLGTQQPQKNREKKQQVFILSNRLSLHSSIVDAKPVTSFPTGPLSCSSMWYMHSNAMWMCVGVCACVSVSNACVLASGLVLSFNFRIGQNSFGVCHGNDNKPLCSPARERPRAFFPTLLSVSVFHLLLVYLLFWIHRPPPFKSEPIRLLEVAWLCAYNTQMETYGGHVLFLSDSSQP